MNIEEKSLEYKFNRLGFLYKPVICLVSKAIYDYKDNIAGSCLL